MGLGSLEGAGSITTCFEIGAGPLCGSDLAGMGVGSVDTDVV